MRSWYRWPLHSFGSTLLNHCFEFLPGNILKHLKTKDIGIAVRSFTFLSHFWWNILNRLCLLSSNDGKAEAAVVAPNTFKYLIIYCETEFNVFMLKSYIFKRMLVKVGTCFNNSFRKIWTITRFVCFHKTLKEHFCACAVVIDSSI